MQPVSNLTKIITRAINTPDHAVQKQLGKPEPLGGGITRETATGKVGDDTFTYARLKYDGKTESIGSSTLAKNGKLLEEVSDEDATLVKQAFPTVWPDEQDSAAGEILKLVTDFKSKCEALGRSVAIGKDGKVRVTKLT